MHRKLIRPPDSRSQSTCLQGRASILASSLSSGHAPGSPEPWVQPFYPFTEQAGASLQQAMMHTGASFHPNEVGMAAIAAELERVLTS